MFTTKPYLPYGIIQKAFNTLLVLLLGVVITAASPIGIQADFSRNNTVIESNEVAGNVFQVKNHTNKTVLFHLTYSVPSGWSILGNPEKEYKIDANDSMFIPIRLIPDKQALGGTSYVVTVTMVSGNVQFAAQNWYVTVPSKSKWTARLPFKHQFFINDNDSSGFHLTLRNEGNTNEEIRITLVPDHRLEITRDHNGGNPLLSFTILLPVGADTTLVFPIKRIPTNQVNQGRDVDLRPVPAKEVYSIQVLARSTKSNDSWSGTTQYTKTGNTLRQNDFSHSSIPLTLEANVYDVLSNGTTMSVDAYGNTSFSGNRMLSYRFQTVFINNYFNEKSFLGNNHYIGYFDGKSSLELGEVNGWGRSLLTGRGVKGSYRFGVNTIGGMYTRSPGFFSNYRSEGYGVYHNLKINRLNWTNQYSRNNTRVTGLGNEIYSSFISFKMSNHHNFSGGGGYSMDYYILQKSTGYGYDLNYAGSFKKINVSVGNSYGTPEYVLARGINMYNSRVTWSKSHKYNFALSTQNFTQKPSYYVNGNLIAGNYIRSDRYELRWGINTKTSSVAIKPGYQWEENPLIRVATRFVGLEYNAKNISQVRFSAMGTMGYAKAVDFPIPDFFVSRLSTYARWEKFYLSLRYTYGPVQLAEQMRYIVDRINPQSLYLVGTYDYWLPNNKVLISTTGNFLYDSYFSKYNFRLRPEVFYYTNSGLRLSFYASFFSTSQGANPMYNEQSGRAPFEKISDNEMNFGFGVRKQFGVPIPGKKFVTMRVVIFKDLNGNQKQDHNEEGAENMLVNIRAASIFNAMEDSLSDKNDNGEDIISNQNGEVVYENIPSGIYRVKCNSLVPNGEWFDAGESEFKVDSKKVLYIPLTRGVRINGSVLIERDKYSTMGNEIDLARIRVTALDSSGKSYSVLTDRKGNFALNIPSGKYTLTINESALGESFVFIQNKINLDLSKNFENFSITFNVVEKKRRIEIKKFNKE